MDSAISSPVPVNGHKTINGNITDNSHPVANGNGILPPSMPVGSYPPSGIDVLVVGTGLAGLTASIECVRKGHNVKVLERNSSINTAGNPMLLTPPVYAYLN
jgi:NADPH-dependent 2,4-dienoyl-CoA reductase/sulfur reductase-like enzyme